MYGQRYRLMFIPCSTPLGLLAAAIGVEVLTGEVRAGGLSPLSAANTAESEKSLCGEVKLYLNTTTKAKSISIITYHHGHNKTITAVAAK